MKKIQKDGTMAVSKGELEGTAIYGKRTLKLYDVFVLWYNNNWVWKCPTPGIVEHYNKHLSANHLDVGVGTGYYMENSTFPVADPKVTLMDLNADCLAAAAARTPYKNVNTIEQSVLEQLDTKHQFDSIALTYLLHCVPGDFSEKGIAFKHLKNNLKPGGTLFGVSLLNRGEGIKRNWQARLQMKYFNATGVFHNDDDTLEGLQRALAENFEDFDIKIIGCAALFSARK